MSYAPFVAHPNDVAREGGLAAGVLDLNVLLVLRRPTASFLFGLRTRSLGRGAPERGAAQRAVMVTAYVVWALTFIGLTAGVANAEWGMMLALTILACLLSQPVTKAHDLEPISN